MSHEVRIHDAQTVILRELLFRPSAGFAELQKPTALTSDHFSFHIRKLIDLGYVEKTNQRGQYQLTVKGKEYANRLDTERNTIERQPKVAVLLVIERTFDKRREVLFQQRLKNPYYGFWGMPTGKETWGERQIETAARELMEETGLTATLELRGLYHELAVSAETTEVLEDKLFFIFHGTNPQGELIEVFEGGANVWLDPETARAKDKTYASFEIELEIGTSSGPLRYEEQTHLVTKEQF